MTPLPPAQTARILYSLEEDYANLLGDWARMFPRSAFDKGLREIGGFLPDFSPEGLQLREAFLEEAIESLGPTEVAQGDKAYCLDRAILLRLLESHLYDLRSPLGPRNNPMYYVEKLLVHPYHLLDYGPGRKRRSQLAGHLASIPEFLRSAMTTLPDTGLNPVLVERSVALLSDLQQYIRRIVSRSEPTVAGTGPTRLMKASKESIQSLHEFCDCVEERVGASMTPGLLGETELEAMLCQKEGLSVNLTGLRKTAITEMEDIRGTIQELQSRQHEPGRACNGESPDRTDSGGSVLEKATDWVRRLRRLVIDRDLVTVPDGSRLQIGRAPEPLRSHSTAFLIAPRGLDEHQIKGHYLITPPEEQEDMSQAGWGSPASRGALPVISAHETYPGHHLHLLHQRRCSSIPRRLFGTYHFYEGWGLYAESLLSRLGLADSSPEVHKAQLRERLWRVARAVVAIDLHTRPGYAISDAVDFFTSVADLEPSIAKLEALRGVYDPGYLNYYLGALLIEELREDVAEAQGASFSLQSFHDQLLSFGAAPIPLIREYWLGEMSSSTPIGR